ncbi:MAG: sigma-70 family RNA polymerase sigma factor [Actinomycetales bacterium]|nr:sigma-70 family RNA polymerase sigma factor [Actinomycetales bacterium]
MSSYESPRNRVERDALTETLLTQAAMADDLSRRRLQDQAIVVNRNLALGLARFFHGRGIENEDLDQVAMVGLCKAVRGYRPAEGTGFLRYAVPTIRGELRRHFRDHGWLVRPSRSAQELGVALRTAEPALEQELGRAPTPAKLAEVMGCDTRELSAAVAAQAGFRGISLDTPFSEDGLSWGEVLTDPQDPSARAEDRVVLRELIDQLDGRRRTILALRFDFDLTQAEIGRIVGLSQMQVSRVLSETLGMLRTWLTEGAPQRSRPEWVRSRSAIDAEVARATVIGAAMAG